jgi:ferredoxin-NADP reductase
MAGGIGVTPMIPMAHRLHALGHDFALHYSAADPQAAGFAGEIAAQPWANSSNLHLCKGGTRADLAVLIPTYTPGFKLYTCGSNRYMDAVFAAATAKGWPDAALMREYFTVPEPPDWVNHPFTLELTKSGKTLQVPADKSATDVLAEAGIPITTKCSDGICGVCAVPHPAGQDIEHRDYVLSTAERDKRVILCCSRAAKPNGTLRVDL